MRNPSDLLQDKFKSKQLSIVELLDVSKLNREEIEERVIIIQEKIDSGEIINEKEKEKFDKIKSKLEIGGVDSVENLKKFVSNYEPSQPINIKYINREFLKTITDPMVHQYYLSEDRIQKTQLKPQIFQPDRQSVVADIDKEVEKDVLLFHDDRYWVFSHNSFGSFNFNLAFNDNKCIIEFEEVKPSYPSSLYPEEIQIKLLKALIKKYKELDEKFSNISELTLQHNAITNDDTLSTMISHIRSPEQKYDDGSSTDLEKVDFPKTPNGNNIMNFLREFAKNFCQEKDIKFDKGKTKLAMGNNRLSISFKFLIHPSDLVSEPLGAKLKDKGKSIIL
ncbi:MAG: hypothetical protein ACO26G_06530 [Rickettsiales bacterium]